MKKLLLLILVAGSCNFALAQDCDDLFISEYIEGWSNNKAIELYNPTSSSIDLAGYKLERYSNGSNSAAENQKIELVGTITAYGTYVIVIDQRDPEGEGQDARNQASDVESVSIPVSIYIADRGRGRDGGRR